MSHPVNDELLETLYEEELDYFTNKKLDLERINILFTQDDINNAAEIMARRRFEAMS